MTCRLVPLALLAGLGCGTGPAVAADPPPTAEQTAFFEKKIRPVLVVQCYGCHSAKAEKVKGGLVLDTRDGLRRGGDSGPAVVSGQPDRSLLVQSLRHADSAPAMPPKEKLADAVVDDFERWVKMGAPDPRDGKPVAGQAGPNAGGRFWSFVPPRKTEPPAVRDAAWPRTPVDRFLLAGLEAKGLKPVADAGPHALVRRLHFDLVGLPPSPDDVERFVAAHARNPQVAVEAEADRLLASPHFGERWGRHWLDVARFAESSGRQTNFNYPHAWRYRDWVIAALNRDLPFDQFVREQVAGDLLPTDDPKERAARQIATGFLAIGPKAHGEPKPLQFKMDLADEQLDVVSQAFLGLSVACARCHDHKFDPIPQTDYYALAGIFAGSETCYGTIRIIQSLHLSPLIDLPDGSGQPDGVGPLTAEQRATLEREVAEIKARREKQARENLPMTGADFNNLALRENRLASYTADGRPWRWAMGVRERAKPADLPLLHRGEIDAPGDPVPRGVPRAVGRPVSIPAGSSGRKELADWLASADNPLTARVFVNRVWLHLFGRGIVPTPDNFGAAGLPPDNPALLDHLATTFTADGWSVKRLVRRLVLSRAYQLSSNAELGMRNAESKTRVFGIAIPHSEFRIPHSIDPDNALVWRMAPRRLDAEALRDALLDAAGRLETTPPAGSAVAASGDGNSFVLMRTMTKIDADHRHRAVYLPVVRDSVPESLALFDFPDASLVSGQRATTNVPPQGLFLLNSPFVLAQAEAAATRLLGERTDDADRLRLAYLRFLGRPPTADERRAAERFLTRYPERLAADGIPAAKRPAATWAALCQALTASGDFLFLR